MNSRRHHNGTVVYGQQPHHGASSPHPQHPPPPYQLGPPPATFHFPPHQFQAPPQPFYRPNQNYQNNRRPSYDRHQQQPYQPQQQQQQQAHQHKQDKTYVVTKWSEIGSDEDSSWRYLYVTVEDGRKAVVKERADKESKFQKAKTVKVRESQLFWEAN